MFKKIISIENLKTILKKERKKGKRVVLCHGVFDLLHVGHIKHFKEAKTRGDILVVTITPDIYVNKGPGRPAFNEHLRLEAVASLDVVDYVALNTKPSAVNLIKKIKPNIYCKGPDYKNYEKDITNQIKNEVNAIKSVGGKIVHTEGITFSSSKLINKFGNLQSADQKQLIKKIKKQYSFDQIQKLINNFKKIKVLIVGEIIIDQYNFCEALGKSGKEPILVFRDLKTEEYLGGSAALSRHISPFCKNISLLSMVGEKGDYLSKIKKDLPKNIKFKYIKKRNSPTILKRRFLDNIDKKKVFGVYMINDNNLSVKQDKLFSRILKNMLPKYDLVIVSDYGHGFISKNNANLLCKKSKYLAVNAQVNAANVGYHSMRNYKNVDCVIINNREMQHEMRDRSNKTEFLMKKLSQQQKINNLVVTRGAEGAALYNKKDNNFNFCGAYAGEVIDKIGAGDAMLSIVALCLKSNLSRELSLLLGSLAAAQSTETIGNKEAVNRNKILRVLETLFK